MNSKSKLFAVAGAVTAFIVLTGFGPQGSSWGPRESSRAHQVLTWQVDDRLEALKASSAQKQAVHALKDALFTDGEQLYTEQNAANERMLEFWASHSPDPRAVHELVEARMNAFRGYAHRVADAALEAHQILTPEQRQQVANDVRSSLNAQ